MHLPGSRLLQQAALRSSPRQTVYERFYFSVMENPGNDGSNRSQIVLDHSLGARRASQQEQFHGSIDAASLTDETSSSPYFPHGVPTTGPPLSSHDISFSWSSNGLNDAFESSSSSQDSTSSFSPTGIGSFSTPSDAIDHSAFRSLPLQLYEQNIPPHAGHSLFCTPGPDSNVTLDGTLHDDLTHSANYNMQRLPDYHPNSTARAVDCSLGGPTPERPFDAAVPRDHARIITALSPPAIPRPVVASAAVVSAAVSRRTSGRPAPYVCRLCNARFTSGHNLTNHTRSHLNIRSHLCKGCRRAFVTKHDRRRHERTCQYCQA
ncbi:hypothetical protein PM082_022578 [Marasmius tenuissimus]|nr:hypothetical protein PM082_022578 [Marasmius tenuissimus]